MNDSDNVQQIAIHIIERSRNQATIALEAIKNHKLSIESGNTGPFFETVKGFTTQLSEIINYSDFFKKEYNNSPELDCYKTQLLEIKTISEELLKEIANLFNPDTYKEAKSLEAFVGNVLGTKDHYKKITTSHTTAPDPGIKQTSQSQDLNIAHATFDVVFNLVIVWQALKFKLS